MTSAYPTRGANTGPATGHRGNVSAISTGAASFAIKVKTSVIRPPTFAGFVILCHKGKNISYPTPYLLLVLSSFAIKVKTSVIELPFAGSVILCGKGKDISYPTPYLFLVLSLGGRMP